MKIEPEISFIHCTATEDGWKGTVCCVVYELHNAIRIPKKEFLKWFLDPLRLNLAFNLELCTDCLNTPEFQMYLLANS